MNNSELSEQERLELALKNIYVGMAQLIEAAIPAINAAVVAFNQTVKGLQDAGVLNKNGKLESNDRPAWQSTHGPAQRKKGK
jgi:hypothetical protein